MPLNVKHKQHLLLTKEAGLCERLKSAGWQWQLDLHQDSFPPLSCKFLSLQGHLRGTQRSSRLCKVHAKEAIHSWNWPGRTGDSLGDTYWYPPLLLSGCDTMNPKDLKCPWEVTLWGKKRKKPSWKWGGNISFRKKLHVVLTANAKSWFRSQGDPGQKRPETMRMDPWWGRGTH